ncbi:MULTISPECIES: VOC family protein [unclassified Arthrobacter]|uniref:VOC family protein n=1 Tax=unclassified Arthrobacter TaxID=235627 RepID=UPI001C860B0E|nr:VOC family protein [Arthrobacter sp. MAHUQ-56]MBX7444407.1 VOC family protein [Arthrobacter sp. MAHUQ-56]
MSWGLISAMGHVSIQTTDLANSVFDATQILGLRETERTADAVYLAAANVHHELVYVESEVNGVDGFGLVAANGDALREIRRRVENENLTIVSNKPRGAGIEDGFSFIGPEGVVFEIYVGMQENSAIQQSFGPDRYGHFNFHPRDVGGMMRFLHRVLDFRLSDVIGDDFAYFMRCNPDHHGIALVRGEGTLHHHAWQTQSIADLGKLGDRLNKLGRELIWGPVRHGAGHNIAAYYVETSGAVVELYTDLEQIYDDSRPPVVWGEDENWYNMWSAYRPMEFRKFGLAPVDPRFLSNLHR